MWTAAMRVAAVAAAAMALGAALAACAGPPHSTARDADVHDGAAADSASGDAWANMPDAAIDALSDAMPDALSDAMPDALVDAQPDAGGDNPFAITLTEISASLGAAYRGGRRDGDVWGMGSGAAVGDVDGDGDLDLFLARCDSLMPPGGPSILLRQTGPTVFTADTALAAEFTGTCAHGAAFGDIDRDGDIDLFVAMNGVDRLYRNDAGSFIDITAAAGVAGPGDNMDSNGYFADINRDGLLDLLVLGHLTVSPPAADPRAANRLYINRGDGSFADVSTVSGVAGNGSSQAALIADLDGDLDLEIYIANDRFAIDGMNAVAGLDADQWLDITAHDSQGTPMYIDRGALYGVDGPRSSMGVAVTDLDGDGRDDIYVTDWGANHLQMWNAAAGVYDDRAAAWNVALPRNARNYYEVGWDALFTDLDRDGSEELFVINGAIHDPLTCSSWSQLDRLMRRPAGIDAFVDITAAAGWPALIECPPVSDRPISGRGVLLADIDGDGDDDVLVTPYIETYRLYRNDTPGGHHALRIEPRGVVSAPTPHGAVLEVTRANGVVIRRVLAASGAFAQHAAVLEAGLGADTTVIQAVLRWPSGYVQRIDQHPGFALDTPWVLVEPAWLTLSARVVSAADTAPELVYRPVHASGAFVGPAAAGRAVTAVRSDGVAVTMTDRGDGSYAALMPHPGSARVTVIEVSEAGVPLGPRLTVFYK